VRNTPPTAPAERIARLLRWLAHTVAAFGGAGWVRGLLIAQIADCLRDIEQAFAHLAACLAAGTYPPRLPPATPQRPAADPGRTRRSQPPPDAVGARAPRQRRPRQPETIAPPTPARPPRRRPPLPPRTGPAPRPARAKTKRSPQRA